MKACIFQPPYSRDLRFSDHYFGYKMMLLNECDKSLDIIVLPEYSDVPCATENLEDTLYYHNKYFNILMNKCRETAKRCNSLLFVNALSLEDGKYRNTTFAFGRDGELLGKYFKLHLPPSEKYTLKLDESYAESFDSPFVLETEGLRIGFLTCYDFYFYEYFPRLAKENLDIIIGCSLQRSDSHEIIETTCKFLSYNTNSYVIRSSVSFNEDSDICGASLITTPKGETLVNMKGKFGKAVAEFDPKDKFYKPAGFGGRQAPHFEYMELGRKPHLYRNAGAGVILSEKELKYPRICAHRGFSTIAPENTLPAYGAAVAMGAEEIEFDLWPTLDKEIVSCHDDTLERVSTGEGKIYNHTLSELLNYDFGVKFSEKFKGLKITLFEDILKRLGNKTIMNIHVKPYGEGIYPTDIMEKIVSLIRKYDCEKHVYFMLGRDADITKFKNYAPDIPVCVGHDFDRNWEIVERAINLGAEKVQFFKPYISREMIEKAHKHGIICNVFWSDDPEEAKEFLNMGVDTVLTNDYNLVSQILK
ncbi:MAG: hypothetical protein E7564_03885 [Ruminococcaceae bacterium]|nr:hypothetical protein [Oscillospiraceae bacterium]